MKLDFEIFLNANGLKVGDKIRFNGDNTIFEIAKEEKELSGLHLKSKECWKSISMLQQIEFEKVKPKKVGDLICDDTDCTKCPLHCIDCQGDVYLTLKEKFGKTLRDYPQLEPMREYLEQELDKEIE